MIEDDLLNDAERVARGDEAWLQDERNARGIDRVALLYRVLARVHFPGLREWEWQRLRRRVRETRRWQTWRRVVPAAAVVAAILGGTWWFTLPREGVETAAIVPGDYRAELVLGDGQVIALARENKEIRAGEGTSARADSTGALTYERRAPREAVDAAWNTLRVPPGGFYTVTLADGTRVWLNASSRLRYPVEFRGDAREVELHGEGYFEVEADERRPFTVSVDGARVTALGTAFNVNARGEEGKIHATLARGKVEVLAGTTGRRVLLSPGMQGTIDVATGAIETRAVDVTVYTSWKDGIFYFKEMTLEEILNVLARWYRVDIEYADRRPRHDRYNGKMPMYTGIEDVLRKIEMSGHARFVIEGHRLVVFARQR